MSTWILVLTLWGYNGKAIESIPGFKSKEACMAAADSWLRQKPSTRDVDSQPTALCLEQKQ